MAFSRLGDAGRQWGVVGLLRFERPLIRATDRDSKRSKVCGSYMHEIPPFQYNAVASVIRHYSENMSRPTPLSWVGSPKGSLTIKR